MSDTQDNSSDHVEITWLEFPKENIYFRPDIQIGFKFTQAEMRLNKEGWSNKSKRINFNIDLDKNLVTDALPVDNPGVAAVSFSVVKKRSIPRLLDESDPEFIGSYYANFPIHLGTQLGLIYKKNEIVPGERTLFDEVYIDKLERPSLFIYCPGSGNAFTPLCHLQSNRPELENSERGINSEVMVEIMLNRADLDRWADVYRKVMEFSRSRIFVSRV